MKNENIDAVLAAMTITPERKKQIDFSDPYFYAGQSLLVKDDSTIKSIKDMNGKTALAVKGTTAVANVKKFAPKAKVLEFDDVGIWLYVKKLHKGQFPYPDNKQGRYEITTKDLEIILSGLDFICQIQNENKQYKYY